MANTNTFTLDYNGEVAGEILTPVLLGSDSYANGYFRIHEGVKYQTNIPVLSISGDIVQTWSCDYSADGTVSTIDVAITPTKLKTDHTICKANFRNTWWANQTGSGFANDIIPTAWQSVFLEHLGGTIMTTMENTTWSGNFESSAFTAFNGILKRLDDDSATIKQNISAITAGNVIAQMQLAVDAMTAAMVGNYDFKIKVNKKTAHLLRRAYNNDFNNLIYTGTMPLQFEGYEVEICPGIPDSVIVIAKTDNLHVGVDLVNDFVNVRIVDTAMTLNDDNVRFRAQYAVGTAVTLSSETVLAGVGIES